MILKFSLAIFAIAGIVHVIFGVIYITADEFMSYHSQALMVPWSSIDSNYQTLLLALLKLAGAGGLIAGIVNLSLVFHTLYNRNSKLVWLLSLSSLMFQLTMNFVVYSVYVNTPGEPPLLAVSVGTVLLAIACTLLIIDKVRNSA